MQFLKVLFAKNTGVSSSTAVIAVFNGVLLRKSNEQFVIVGDVDGVVTVNVVCGGVTVADVCVLFVLWLSMMVCLAAGCC